MVRKQQPLPFIVFGMTLVDPAPTGNRTHKTSWSVLGPFYQRLLRSAGATEGLFATMELHQEPPPWTPTVSAKGELHIVPNSMLEVWRDLKNHSRLGRGRTLLEEMPSSTVSLYLFYIIFFLVFIFLTW